MALQENQKYPTQVSIEVHIIVFPVYHSMTNLLCKSPDAVFHKYPAYAYYIKD